MNCQLVDNYIYAYCNGTLSPHLQKELETHMAHCQTCKNNYQLTRMENEILQDISNIPNLSEDFTGRVITAIQTLHPCADLDTKNTRHYSKQFPWKNILLGSVAAVVILLFFVMVPGLTDVYSTRVADKGNALLDFTTPADERKSMPETSKETIARKTDSKKEVPPIAVTTDALSSESPDLNRDESHSPNLPSLDSPRGKTFNTIAIMADKEAVGSSSSRMVAEANKQFTGPRSRLLNLYPANLPSAYQLVQIMADEEEEISFKFADNQNSTMVITIAVHPDDTNADTAEMLYMASVPGEVTSSSEPPKTSISPKTAPLYMDNTTQPGYTWVTVQSGQTYTVTLKGDLSYEKLAKLATMIQIKEVTK
ncbi:anti-sigma factor family protein [Syntrophomonas erecta]